ncbi:hypothetical protein FACS189496_4970 [Bacilli bacterium]|nr:hypothetical protein FACS189496_4970 [Bacilli bacterium]
MDVQYLLDNNCKIIILSHLGRVETLEDIGKRSLAPIAKKLQDLLLNTNVKFINDSVGESVINAANNLNNKEILLLENTRYNDIDSSGNLIKKESKCDNELGKF